MSVVDGGTQAQNRPTPATNRGGFFRRAGRWIRNYFMVVGIIVTVLPLLLVFSVARLAKSSKARAAADITVDAGTELTLDLAGPIEEGEPGYSDTIIARLFGGDRSLFMSQLRAAMRRATKDERIKGLTLDLTRAGGSMTSLTELRRTLVDFAASGKTVTAMLHSGDENNYYLASAATRIVLNPASGVEIFGPTLNLTYFGEALRKIGVDIEVVRAGKYKSAFEPFVKDEPSEPTLEEYRAIAASLLDHKIEVIAASRKQPAEKVRGWFKRSLFTAPEAAQEGLVDEVGYLPVVKPDSKGRVKLTDYLIEAGESDQILPSAIGDDGIALIEASGEIGLLGGDGDSIAPAPITKRIHWAMEESNVKAVVLRINSPGGSATASEMIWKELAELAKVKPLVVSMGGLAASGGYYIAAPAKRIFAEPTTITGSIGVIGMLPNFGPFKEKYGISMYVITESDRAAMLSLAQKPTATDKAMIEKAIDQVYQQFLQRVAEGRGIAIEKVAELAQGRVYTGMQAKTLGLVDELGGLTAAFTEAKKLGGLDPEKLYPVHRYEEDVMDLSRCFGGPARLKRCFGAADAGLGPLDDARVQKVAKVVRGWIDTSTNERALALWPAYLAIKPL